MIQPVMIANQAVNNNTKVADSASFKGNDMASLNFLKSNDMDDNEKLDINFKGCRIHSLNGNKVDFFA